MGEGKGLPRTAFNYHKMKEMWEWMGLPRITFCHNQNGGNRGIGKVYLDPPFATTILVEMGEVKGLPRATFKYHKIEEMGRKGAAPNHPFL